MFASELMLCLAGLLPPQAPPEAPAMILQEIPLRGIVAPARGVYLPTRFILESEDGGVAWAGIQLATSNDIAAVLHSQFEQATASNELYVDVNDSLIWAPVSRGS